MNPRKLFVAIASCLSAIGMANAQEHHKRETDVKHEKLTQPLAVIAIAFLAATATAQEFEFKAGYPTAESSQVLYDEMDYQRAVQAYIWATPMLNSMGMRAAFARYGVTEHNRKIMAFEYSLLPQHI